MSENDLYNMCSPHDDMEELMFNRAIAKIKADAIRDAASGLIDWDIMNGQESPTAESNISHSNAAYLMRIADGLEEETK